MLVLPGMTALDPTLPIVGPTTEKPLGHDLPLRPIALSNPVPGCCLRIPGRPGMTNVLSHNERAATTWGQADAITTRSTNLCRTR